MLIADEEAAELRKWLIGRLQALEAIADEDVLADYIIALLRTDTPEAQLRLDAYENLEDFLREDTRPLIDQLFALLDAKLSRVKHDQSISSKPIQAKSVNNGRPNVQQDFSDFAVGSKNSSGWNTQRSKSFGLASRSERPQRDGKIGKRYAGRGKAHMARLLPGMPTPFMWPPNIQQAMRMFESLQSTSSPQSELTAVSRCWNYDNLGFCVAGELCPLQHGDDHVTGFVGGQKHGNGFTTGRSGPKRPSSGKHSNPRSKEGQSHTHGDDYTDSTLIVDSIPEDRLNEDAVQEAFAPFGSILNIHVEPRRHLARVQYADRQSATRAIRSPKVVFDNRFVKIYWYKPGKKARHPERPHPGAEVFDPVDFARRAAEAQERFEHKQAQLKSLETQRQELESQRQDLMHRQLAERRKMSQKLLPAEHFGESQNGLSNGITSSLKAKLLELEAEARMLGVNLKEDPSSLGGQPASRRGKNGFRFHGGGKYNLDLRPTAVAITGPDWTSEKDEILRQHLLAVGEYRSVDVHPRDANSLIVVFKDRQTAERFYYGPREVQDLGKLDRAWWKEVVPSVVEERPGGDRGLSRLADLDGRELDDAAQGATMDVDYDVAEDRVGHDTAWR